MRYIEDSDSPVYVFKIRTFTVDFFFSSIFHAVLIYFFLTIPLYKIGSDTTKPDPYKVQLIASQEGPIINKIDKPKVRQMVRPKKIEKGVFIEPPIIVENTPSSDIDTISETKEAVISESTTTEISNITSSTEPTTEISNITSPAEPAMPTEQVKKKDIEILPKLDIESASKAVAEINEDIKDETKGDIGQSEGILIAPLRAVEIEVYGGGKEIFVMLTKRGHPLMKGSSKEVEVNTSIEKSGTKTIFGLEEAEPGIYTFSINGKEPTEVEVRFILRGKGEGIKTYKAKLEGSGLKYKFLMPEAIFWDDDFYFTGTIEGVESITKFNGSTGIYWTEKRH